MLLESLSDYFGWFENFKSKSKPRLLYKNAWKSTSRCKQRRRDNYFLTIHWIISQQRTTPSIAVSCCVYEDGFVWLIFTKVIVVLLTFDLFYLTDFCCATALVADGTLTLLKCIFSPELYFTFLTAIDGGWSAWGKWTSCSVTWDHGIKKHERKCNSLAPSGDGRPWRGSSFEQFHCIIKDCNNDWFITTSFDNCLSEIKRFCKV